MNGWNLHCIHPCLPNDILPYRLALEVLMEYPRGAKTNIVGKIYPGVEGLSCVVLMAVYLRGAWAEGRAESKVRIKGYILEPDERLIWKKRTGRSQTADALQDSQ